MLTEWRMAEQPADLQAFEHPSMERLVAGILARAKLEERPPLEEVAEEWASVAGPFAAQHARPVGFRGGILLVAVTQAAVLYDLERNHKAAILQRLGQRFTRIGMKGIRFVPG